MLALAWANLTHHKLRSVLSALAVGIGIMLMLVSKGLATGSIAEVDQRMQSVEAELIILPSQDNAIMTFGNPFRAGHERCARECADADGRLAEAVVPVFVSQVHMGGQQQRVLGVDPAQMQSFLGPRRVIEGKLFDRAHLFAARAEQHATPAPDLNDPAYAAFIDDGLELVIDERLARVGNYHVGDPVQMIGQSFRIVGIVEAGVAGRVFAPLQTLREIAVAGDRSSQMMFVKLRRGQDPARAAEQCQAALGDGARVELKSSYGRILHESFASVNLYMNATSGVALTACFLFILLTMYTLVIERTREIGILKSLGVTRLGLVRLSVLEALMISIAGVAIGIVLALGGRSLIMAVRPLLTVELSSTHLLLALLIGILGGTLSALYPGYRAARLDPAVALTNE